MPAPLPGQQNSTCRQKGPFLLHTSTTSLNNTRWQKFCAATPAPPDFEQDTRLFSSLHSDMWTDAAIWCKVTMHLPIISGLPAQDSSGPITWQQRSSVLAQVSATHWSGPFSVLRWKGMRQVFYQPALLHWSKLGRNLIICSMGDEIVTENSWGQTGKEEQ